MSSLAIQKRALIKSKSDILVEAIDHFNAKSGDESETIAVAAEHAMKDPILFEEFELWHQSRNDDVLFFHAKKFLERADQPPLPPELRDLTGNETEIRKIKENADRELAQSIARKVTKLANERRLSTNGAIGEFLGGMHEAQVRVLLNGDHKPQRKTLLKLAEAFGVSVEFFLHD